jgi:DNA repair protein SbcC/Rad50
VRLHRLTLTAFGPFAATQHVDFDALASAGLFLLHGATGAGKTTVLDAVCFALYGRVPGARQQPGGGLRSHHAAVDVRTEVTLDFTLAGRRLEVTRRPEQPRPKTRGAGLTRERAHSTLRERDPGTGRWEALSRSHQEIGLEIEQLLGMTCGQFCQVVLLPQGDFHRFLRAGAEDRADLLGRLFGTERFAGVEEELARMRRAAHEDVRAGEQRLLGLLHRVRQASGQEEPRTARPAAVLPDQRGAEQADQAPSADEVLAQAAQARSDARERRDIAQVALRAAEERHTAARLRHEEQRELHRLQQRHAEVRARLEALEAGRDAHEDDVRRLERARSAAAVAPAAALHDAARAGHRQAAAAEADARDRLAAEDAAAGPQELTARERAARQELGALASARRAEERRGRIDDELANLERQSHADAETAREAAGWLAGWEERREAGRRRITRAQEAATRAERLAGQLEPTRRRLAAARTRDRLTAQLHDAGTAAERARERAAGTREYWLGLRERRLDGLAAELAAELRAGEACAVCGASEHPRPARPRQDHVTRQAEDDALRVHQAAQQERERAAGLLEQLRQSLAAARQDAGDATAEDLAAALGAQESELAHAREEAADAHAAQVDQERAESEHTRRLTARQEAENHLAAHTSRREALQAERTALEAEVSAARCGAAGVAERAAYLERRADALSRAAEAAHAAAAAAAHLRDAARQHTEAARQAGFAGTEDAGAAALTAHQQQMLRQRIEQRQAEESALRSEAADRALHNAARQRPAAPEDARRALEAAAAGLRTAGSAVDAARERCAALDRLGGAAAEAVREGAPVREAYRRLAALASLTAGTSIENTRRMRLETYVLAARLEQVAAAAGVRLARMSAGRYTLTHSDRRASGRGRSGLGLHVVDAWTGVERDTATLSGGETFFASLALALGLADVVTDEAGGTRLETLFVDEGFGTLDEQSLDEVLDVLDSLRERERSVGIVSHVADLRRRIPAQLEVVKDRDGSRLRHRGASAAG